MLLTASVYITTRYMRKMHFAVFCSAYGYISSLEVLLLAIPFGFTSIMELPRSPEHWLIICGIALLSFASQIFATLGLKFENAGLVSLIRTCDIVFFYVIQFTFLGLEPDLYRYVPSVKSFFSIPMLLIEFNRDLL